MKTHHLKCVPSSFVDVIRGVKTFEVRKNDRKFAVGDLVYLWEWLPVSEQPTGRLTSFVVRYMVQGKWGLAQDICVLGFDPMQAANSLSQVDVREALSALGKVDPDGP